MNRLAVHDELERSRTAFRELLTAASAADLRRRSSGTRWTNKQLLFHMLLGYLITRALRNLVVLFSRLPEPVGRGYARGLNAVTVPFDAVNFAGAWLARLPLSDTALRLPSRSAHAGRLTCRATAAQG